VDDAKDYREFLRYLMAERKLTQREVARMVGLSPPWLSQILHGRRRLKPSLAERLAEELKLSERDRLKLLSLVERDVGNSSLIRGRAVDLLTGLDKAEPHEVTPQALRARLGQWHTGAILELARCDDYVPDPRWVAAALRPSITPEQAEQAMRILQDHEYLDADYRLVQPGRDAGTPQQLGRGDESRSIAAYHEETLALAISAIRRELHRDRLFMGGTVALSEDDWLKLRSRFAEMFNQLLLSASKEQPDRVYHVNLAAFPLSFYSDSIDLQDVVEPDDDDDDDDDDHER